MKANDYIRTEDGGIGKVIEIICSYDKKNDHIITDNNTIAKGWDGEQVNDTYRSAVVKSSPNIIDLIEVGDYVNGHKVNYINKDREHFNISFGDENFNLKSKFNSDIYWLSKEDIKSIVTKEMFKNMEYKLEVKDE